MARWRSTTVRVWFRCTHVHALTFNAEGPRPNYQSSIAPLTYKGRVYDDKQIKHETFIGLARHELSTITELDFEQPRALYHKAMDQTAREHLVHNLAVHMKGIKDQKIAARQLSVFAAVDQGFSDALAKQLGISTVKPLQPAPADAFRQVKLNIGLASQGQS